MLFVESDWFGAMSKARDRAFHITNYLRGAALLYSMYTLQTPRKRKLPALAPCGASICWHAFAKDLFRDPASLAMLSGSMA
jgi:hypothetical protein